MASDFYEKGKELSKAGLYQILAEETWRDGELGSADSEVLEGLRKYLRLKNDMAMQILDIAEEKYRTQNLGRLRDFSPNQCYSRALRYAFSDEVDLSKREDKYLRGLRAAMGLSDQDHDSILQKLESRGWRRGPEGRLIEFEDAPMGEGGVGVTDGIPAVPEVPFEAPRLETPPVVEIPEAAPPVKPPPEPETAPPKANPPEQVDAPEPEPAMSPEVAMRASSSQKIRKQGRDKKVPSNPGASQIRKPEEPSPPSLGNRLQAMVAELPPMVRLILLVGCFMGIFIVILPQFMGGPGEDPIAGPAPTQAAGQGQFKALEDQFGKALFKVKQLVVRGPDPPDGPPLDLGDAWDLFAGRDGKLYGTAQSRIFQIDTKSGKARWIAGNGKIGEPEEGKKAIDSPLDPASPRVDTTGALYFRQGSSGVFKVGKNGILEHILGTREARIPWNDGDLAKDAKPGAIEQIALGMGGRLYFDEYSGETKGPEILGRVEPGGKLRAMFLFALEPIDHSYSRLVKSFIGSGNGFENLVVGEDGALYFSVGGTLYRWMPGEGPPVVLLPEAPMEYTVDEKGALIVVKDGRIERWRDILKWTREEKFIDLVAGGRDEVVPASEGGGSIPGTAAGYVQPRDLTIGPDGTLFVLDGSAGGVGLSRPRIEMIKLIKP